MPPHSPLGLLDRFVHGPAPCAGLVQPALPLQGLTVLAVEDSRYSSDALRLMCQRSGARLRRVDCLQTAYAHLHVYCPDVILIDIGLPDGRGDLLIRDIANQRPEGPVIIAISGDPDTRTVAMQAGAQGFLDKPFPALAKFQDAILRHLPDRADRNPATTADQAILPDPLALQNDLEHAAALVTASLTPVQARYLAGFVAGIAQSAYDPALARAAQNIAGPDGLDRLGQLLASRIRTGKNPFSGDGP